VGEIRSGKEENRVGITVTFFCHKLKKFWFCHKLKRFWNFNFAQVSIFEITNPARNGTYCHP